MGIFGWIEARAWQVGAVAAAAVALAMAVSLGVTTFQKRGLERDVARLEKTLVETQGNLTTCRENTRNLEDAINEQNREIQRISQESASRLETAQKDVAAARAATANLQSKLNRLLSAPATGGTVCERLDEIDRAVMESLK